MSYALPGSVARDGREAELRPAGFARAGQPDPRRDAGGDLDPADALCGAERRHECASARLGRSYKRELLELERADQPHRAGGAREPRRPHRRSAGGGGDPEAVGRRPRLRQRGRIAGHSDGHRLAGRALSPGRSGPEKVGVSEARRARVRIERRGLR